MTTLLVPLSGAKSDPEGAAEDGSPESRHDGCEVGSQPSPPPVWGICRAWIRIGVRQFLVAVAGDGLRPSPGSAGAAPPS